MVTVHYKARIGNNLFQYALGRIIAEHLGYELEAAPLPGFPRTSEPVVGARHPGPNQVLTGHRVDLDAVLADRRPRRIVLDGWFQRLEYYQPQRAQLTRWFAVDAPAAPADMVIHIRRTDHVTLQWALPFSYYEEAMARALPPGGRPWIATDDPLDPFFWRFRRWRPRFFHGTPAEDFALLLHANIRVLSQSTFSWWAGFLGAGQTIAPVPRLGPWSEIGANGNDLLDRERFLCLNCAEPYRPTRMEKIYQGWRYQHRRIILKMNRTFGTALAEPPPL